MSAILDEWISKDGRARLICGDCLAILPTLAAGSVDCCITDPPYSSLDVSVSTGTTTRLVRRDEFAGKRLSSSNGKRWFDTISAENLPAAFSAIRRCLSDTAAMYVFADVKTGLDVFPGLNPANVIVWDKGRLGMGYNWRRMHEWIAYCPMNNHKLRSLSLGDIVRAAGVDDKTHPTQKPVAALLPLLENSTDIGSIVLDPFMGTGSTGAAAMESGRRFVGIEISPAYFAIAKQRIERAICEGSDCLPFAMEPKLFDFKSPNPPPAQAQAESTPGAHTPSLAGGADAR